MITQQISPYKEKVSWSSNYFEGASWQNGRWQSRPTNVLALPTPRVTDQPINKLHAMTKIEYALWLKTLPFKVGDLVVSKFQRKPYYVRSVHRVLAIDEIHHFIDWGGEAVGPMCLNLQPCKIIGGSPIKGGGKMYIKVEGDDIPEEWRVQLETESK